MGNFEFLANILAATTKVEEKQYVPIDFIWNQITNLSWLHALLAVSFGVVYLLYGWRIFKALAAICFAMMGLFAGMMVGKQIGHEMWGGVVGVFLLTALSLPLMKWCICILGAMAGATLTGSLWYAFGLPQVYIWAGMAIGLVAGGMISFIVFKAAVMLFTSLAGAVIITIGILSLLYHYENLTLPPTTYIDNLVHGSNWFLPLAILVPTIIGIIAQNRMIRKSPDWTL